MPEAVEDERSKDEGTIIPGFIHSASPEKTYLHYKMSDKLFFLNSLILNSDIIIPYDCC